LGNGNGVEDGDEAKPLKDKPFDTNDTNDTISSHLAGDESARVVRPGPALWRNKDHDQPVTVIGEAGEGSDGRRYVNIAESEGAIPFDEVYYDEKPSSDLGNESANCPGCGRAGLRFTHCDECGEFLR